MPHNSSSASEDDQRKVKVKMRLQPKQSTPPSSHRQQIQQQQQPGPARANSFSSSDSADSTDQSSSDLDDDGNSGHGKRPPKHLRASKKYPSSKTKVKKERSAQQQVPSPLHHHLQQPQQQGNAPISLSASQPVYSQAAISASATAIASRGISTPSRGRGRGRGRGTLTGHASRKYDASGATVIDFEDFTQTEKIVSPSIPVTPASVVPIHNHHQQQQELQVQPLGLPVTSPADSKKEQSVERIKANKPAKASNSKPKSGSARKVGRPKTVSKDVYCICRGPYDGVEFMIACDRCEEWFHGRCIGMKPQDAKKSNHYYCDQCLRIRQMLGVSSAVQEPTKPPKVKSRSKKSEEKRSEKQENVVVDLIEDDQVTVVDSPRIEMQGLGGKPKEQRYSSSSPQPLHVTESMPAMSVQQASPKKPKAQSGKIPRRKEQELLPLSLQYEPHPTTINVPTYTAAAVIPSLHQVPPTMEDDDEEDVCPVCEDECTCNTGGSTAQQSVPPSASTTPLVENSHSFNAIKVPFQPNTAAQEPQDVESIPTRSYQIMSDDETVPEPAQPYASNTFLTSYKNPMSTPRRPSILRRGGKGIGKAPHLMQAVKGRSRGKSLKGGKASMHLYQQTLSTSSSDISEALSDEEDEDEGMVVKEESSLRRIKYDRESENIPADGHMSLDSSSSLSDFEDEEEEMAVGRRRSINTHNHNNRPSSDSVTDNNQPGSSSTTTQQGSPVNFKIKAEPKKRGPGRPKKRKDALVVSREDEKTLYTPAIAASRKAATHKHSSGRSETPSTIIIESEFPFIAYDPEVAQDVKALNGSGSDADSGPDVSESDATAAPSMLAVSHDDIFGDGDLSDELSGDLSDISSEDLDDLSDDGLDFSSSDEEDEVSSSSSPKEFHYSDMEEQDESLVDSDSSENSVSSESSGSSDIETDSDIEPYPQDLSEDDDPEQFEFEVEGEEELIDDEELLRLEEQERHFLAKAQGLHEDFSDEESDPGRNPFDSSESEHERDENEFDGDEDEYSDEFYEDEYSDDGFGELTEAEILEQLRGSQADLALLMIPPEQQEQLLLLQHYEETHRQQQQQLQQQQDGAGLGNHGFHIQTGDHIQGVLSAPGLLPQFDMNVPDLDAVSEQLAASLANSIANSMAQSQPEAFLASTTVEHGIIDNATQSGSGDASANDNTAGPDTVSPVSASSTSPSSGAQAWTVPASLTPTNSSVTGSATIPTPANTPTPPGTVGGSSPTLQTTAESTIAGSSMMTETSKGAILDFNGEPIPKNPTYRHLNSVDTATAMPTSREGATGTASNNQLLLATLGSSSFKEAAQRAFGGIPVQVNTQQTDLPNDNSATADEVIPSGDTTDEASPTMHGGEFRKRHNEELRNREAAMNQGKRRRLSAAPAKQDTEPSSTTATSSIPSLTHSESGAVSLHEALAALGTSIGSYDFSKSTMPFVDPTARIITSPPTVRSRKFSLKGKEVMYASDLMPMDDLVDTSALYGRSSSRSPSPERGHDDGGGGGDNDEVKDHAEMSQSALKDLHRWERVPIGTFRKSRRPSSPYVGLQGALKFGNVTMPATLLANHQLHQQQQQQQLQQQQHLYQNSYRHSRKSGGVRKHRSSSSASDVVFGHHHNSHQLNDSSNIDRHSLAQFKQQHLRSRSSGISTLSHSQTPPSVHAGMAMEGLAGFGSPEGLMRAPISYSRALTVTGDRSMSSRSSGQSTSRRRHRNKNESSSSMARSGHRSTKSDASHAGLGIGLDSSGGVGGASNTKQPDVMTDSSQLPSSACPTPLHSPLFSATRTEERVHHQPSGEAEIRSKTSMSSRPAPPPPEDSLVPHFELDIAKEMEGFHDRLLAKKAAMEESLVQTTESGTTTTAAVDQDLDDGDISV
ncbi:hypothetical protein BGZ83_007249 [Gryganskiella cystojenkinii]|nr:hypothetical protein BGZ83_007249 [Gryganskiella cystojenkinii]